jgi:hypothetical protein
LINSHPNPTPTPVAANATVWASFAGGIKYPASTYGWRTNFKQDGTTDSAFKNFWTPVNPDTANWQLLSKITQRDNFGSMIESKTPSGSGKYLTSSTVIRADRNLPTGSLNNSGFYEGSVFTCDYDLDERVNGFSYFDFQNDWERGFGNLSGLSSPSVSVVSDTTLFGVKSVRVINSFGPTRNFKLEQGRDYTFSAWVKVTGGRAKIGGDYRRISKTSENSGVWPPLFDSDSAYKIFHGENHKSSTSSSWQLLQLHIPALTDLAAENWAENDFYVRVFVGTPDSGGGNAYVSDIRFFPADAQVATNYFYGPDKWYLPRVSVDANNKPGQRQEYDAFGRPSKTYKMRPNDTPILRATKEYKIAGDDVSGMPQ